GLDQAVAQQFVPSRARSPLRCKQTCVLEGTRHGVRHSRRVGHALVGGVARAELGYERAREPRAQRPGPKSVIMGRGGNNATAMSRERRIGVTVPAHVTCRDDARIGWQRVPQMYADDLKQGRLDVVEADGALPTSCGLDVARQQVLDELLRGTRRERPTGALDWPGHRLHRPLVAERRHMERHATQGVRERTEGRLADHEQYVQARLLFQGLRELVEQAPPICPAWPCVDRQFLGLIDHRENDSAPTLGTPTDELPDGEPHEAGGVLTW